MAINIDTLVHNEFGRSATDHLATQIGKPTAQVKSGVERAVTEVLDGFSLMARDESGRQSIYEATRYCDDGILDDPELFHREDEKAAINESNSALGALLGAGNRDNISEAVRSASGLSADDADTITGYVTPGVLAVMKRQLLNGAVLDNSDGIGQMLLGETTVATPGGAIASVDHSVPKSAPRQTSTPVSGAAAAAVHSDGTDMSWLFRWMLPALLLGGLLLGGLRNCGGNNVTAPVAAVDTGAQYESQISSLTAERDEALSDRETAVAEIERLRGELAKPAAVAEPDTTELDAANAEIAMLKEEMAKPADTSDLDAANAEIARLKEEMAKPADTSDLDAANAEIAQLKEELGNKPDNSGQILSLQQMVDDSSLKFAKLESELGTVRTSRDELEGSIAELRAEKETAENNLQSATETNDGLTAEVEGLKQQVIAVEASIAEKNSEVEALTAQLTTMQDEAGVITTERDDALGKISTLQSNLDSALEDASNKREAAVASQTEVIELKKSSAADIASLTDERDALQAEVDNLTASTAQLTDERDSAIQATEQETAKIGALNSNISGLENQLASLSAARDKITGEADDLKGQVSGLEDKVGALESDLASAVDDASVQREVAATALSDIDELKKNLAASGDENSRLKSMIEGRDAFSAIQREKIAALKSDQDNTNGLVADLEGMLDGAKSDLSAASQGKQDLEQAIQEAEALAQAEKDRVVTLSDEISEMLDDAGVSSATVRPIDSNQAVSISMGSSDLYRVGSASLSQQGTGVLETVGGIVGEYKDWRIDVEGHTDSQGIGAALRNTYPTNWELSVARAAAAVRFLQNNADIPAEQLSARGFGEHRPVASNDTPEGREANRRVELILRPKN